MKIIIILMLYWFKYLILFGILTLAYLPLMHGEFLYDGDIYILHNPVVSDARYFKAFMADFFNQNEQLNYIIFRGMYLLWGYDTLGYHIVNFAVHIFNTLLLIRVLKLLNLKYAFLCGAVFALSPLSVYTGGWIFQFRSNFSVFFCLISFIFFVKYLSSSSKLRYVSSVVAFILSLLTKATAILYPVMLTLYLLYKGQLKRAKDLVKLIPYYCCTAFIGYMNVYLQNKHTDTTYDFEGIGSMAERVVLVGKSFWYYTYKIIFPFNLKFLYPKWNLDPYNDLAWLPWLAIGIVTVLLFKIKNERIRNTSLLLWFVYGMTLAPILGFFDIGHMKHSFVANHWAYFGFIIVIIALSSALTYFAKRENFNKKLFNATFGFILVLFAYGSYAESHHFKSMRSYMIKAIEDNPNHYLGYNNLAVDNVRKGRNAEAIPLFKKAIELHPTHKKAPENLARAYLGVGDLNGAKLALEDAIKKNDFSRRQVGALGQVNLRLKNYDMAIKLFEQILSINANDWQTLNNLGLAYALKNQHQKALEIFAAAKKLNPENQEIAYNISLTEKAYRTKSKLEGQNLKTLESSSQPQHSN